MNFYISKLQNTEIAYSYLSHLAENHNDLDKAEIQNYILLTRENSISNKLQQPLHLSIEELPEIEKGYLQLASQYLNKTILHFENEVAIKEDEIGILGEEFMGYSKGIFFIKRYTNFSECYWFFRCIRVVNKEIIRAIQPNQELEKELLHFTTIKVIDSTTTSNNNTNQIENILDGISQKIIFYLAGKITDKLGGMALDYILTELGIKPVDNTIKRYNQLMELIKFKFREEVINEINRDYKKVIDTTKVYNSGSRNSITFDEIYKSVIKAKSNFLIENTLETLNILGEIVAYHLMVIQEMAIREGGNLRYTSYQALMKGAIRDSKLLKNRLDTGTNNRLGMISPVRDNRLRSSPTQYEIFWEDKLDGTGQYKKVLEMHRKGCIEEFTIERNKHYAKVVKAHNIGFKDLIKTIEVANNLGKGIIRGSQLSVANMQQIWMTLHGMLFQYIEGKWKPIFIDLTASGRKKNIWLSAVSVGVDGTVMVLFRDINEIEEKPQSLCTLINGKWEIIDNDCISIGVGDANNVWKVNHKNEVFQQNSTTNTWEKVQGQLEQIAVGEDGTVCGLNSKGNPMRYNHQTKAWDGLGGIFTHISVGNTEIIWALNKNGAVYQYSEMDKKWIHKTTNRKIANVSVGVENIPWFEDEFGNLFRQSNWEYIPTETPIQDVGVYNSSTVYCLADEGTISQYVNGKFEKVEGPPNCKFKSLSVGNSDICGIQDHEKNIPWIRRNGKWESAGDEAISLSIGDTVWGLFWAGGWVRYWEYAWQSLPGNPQLRQISVESAKAVWGLTSIPGIPHTLVDMKKFTPVGTKKFQYIAVGNATHVCGIDENSAIYKYIPEGSLWQFIESGCTKVSIGAAGEVYGIDYTGRLLKYHPETFFDLPIKSPFADLK